MRELINESLIILDMTASAKEDAIIQLVGLLEGDARLFDQARFTQAVLERETLISTAVGFEVAIPHGKSSYVNNPSVAFARLKNTLSWGNERVRLVFLLAVPEEQAGTEHLKLLANLSRRLMCNDFRSKLFRLENKRDIIELLNLERQDMA